MLNVACFVQSCLTDADFVIFLNYCLIGTRLKGSVLFMLWTYVVSLRLSAAFTKPKNRGCALFGRDLNSG